jgi:hypothetical protein
MMCGWEDIQTHVLPALDEARRRIQDVHILADPRGFDCLYETPLYRHLSPLTSHSASLLTWTYLFNHIRCGIFVKISSGALSLFIPFYNPSFRNQWRQPLPFSLDGRTVCSYDEYLAAKNLLLKWPEGVEPDHSRWWSNGAVICNVVPQDGWGDAYLAHLRDMFEAVCATHDVGDVEFFVNKRDNPVLGKNRCSPCGLDPKRPSLTAPAYAPVLGFYSSPAFADIVIPTGEDWELATGTIFPPCARDDRTAAKMRDAVSIPWSSRRPLAVFRGSATGAGVTPDTNLRLALVAKARERKIPGLDAGIVKWALRDKLSGGLIQFIQPAALPFSLSPYMSFGDQCRTKVQIYMDGHAAANRLGSMFLSGSLILRVLPSHPIVLPDGHDSWMTQWLVPYPWHRKGDDAPGSSEKEGNHVECYLGELEEALAWVWEHDEIAEEIASRARRVGRRVLSTSFISSYLGRLLNGLHKKTKGGARSTLFPTSSRVYTKPMFHGTDPVKMNTRPYR